MMPLFTSILKPGWINGTLVKHTAQDVSGKIVAFVDIALPYQSKLLPAVEAGAIAIVVYRDRTDVPGQGMYYTEYKFDEGKLTVPVVEVYEAFKSAASLHKHFPPEGVQVCLWPEPNDWKKANDVQGFQVAWNAVLSAMQVAIIGIGLLRLNMWARSETGLYAIGPMCILLECISSAIRCACTFVDPFMSFRVMPAQAAEVLVTVAFPFQFACGILLTFYWAETLTKNKIMAAPFVSEYKKSALLVIAILFVCEIITSATRTALPITSFNPVYFSQALYVIVAAALTVSYIICAVQIRNRVASTNAPKRSLRNLTIRFTISTVGYVMFIVLIILSIPYMGKPWGWKILFNLIFFSVNITGLLQIYSFVPPKLKYLPSYSHGTRAALNSVNV